MQFRAEAFNVFNHTNFSAVDTNFDPTYKDPQSSSTYGKVTNAHDPRIMQFGLKLNF